MDIIKKIQKSRIILKKILNEEYDTDSLPIFTIDEIDKLFDIESSKNNPYTVLGKGNACNFTLNHRFIKKHDLHILYYNIQKNDKTKVTKSIIDRILSLYKGDNAFFKSTDNILLIINETIKESIINFNNELNLKLTENITDIIENNYGYEKKHFGKVFIFDINTLQFNILEHELVPNHEIIRKNDEINKILIKCNCTINELPIISKNDAIAKIKMCTSGDICKINRHSKTAGNVYYYRVCI